MDDEMRDFEAVEFEHDGISRTVFRQGSGPAVIVLAELPGITPRVLEFARRLPPRGMTVILPQLFGTAGRDPAARSRIGMARMGIGVIGSLCVSRDFAILATGRTSPIVNWLRSLARNEHERSGGPGVGAVGMCFTGGFALAMAVDDRLVAPVLSQPSLPVGLTACHRRSVGLSVSDFAAVKRRCASGQLDVLGLRFSSDRLCPPERFATLREELGDAFVGIELDPDDANPDALIAPHSVLTEHLIDLPGQPTRAALDQVLDFLDTRLRGASTGGTQ
ncbi:MAG: dienelactone hydrolase family protein [Patulibacter sp.]